MKNCLALQRRSFFKREILAPVKEVYFVEEDALSKGFLALK